MDKLVQKLLVYHKMRVPPKVGETVREKFTQSGRVCLDHRGSAERSKIWMGAVCVGLSALLIADLILAPLTRA